ncbi:MAG TPA: DUF4178 domain-containing protein [Candidatus Binatia bacterium]|nr:DUF4178 domain-containing protein [Candidatus Binatia bacterium]
MTRLNCPSCGAPVTFVSAQSLLAVCSYCRASIVRRDLDVEQIGVMGALIEDSTPLQLGAEGVWRSTHFAVVGRLQVRWEQGGWNEWYCVFDDGRAGWLGEAAGEYSMSFETTVPEPLPAWKSLEPGLAVTLGGVAYEVTDAREAEVVGGEGELPFRVGSGWKTRSADLRNETARFATLDYSDEAPRLYLGEVVDVGALKLRGLREFEGWR